MIGIRTGAAAAALVSCVAAAPADLRSDLRATAALYYRNAGTIAAVTGRETAMDYYERLVRDADMVDDPAMQTTAVRTASQLDLSLATALLQRSYRPLEAIRGLGETLVRSSRDSTMQPVAVYVPTDYSPAKPAPLMVFLHGNRQSESYLLAPQYLQDIAQRTGTIVIAPYGRGAYDFSGTEGDVYDAFDAAGRAFAIDGRRRYLTGYSMGGFSVFRLAPLHPGDWSAVMAIAGSLLASRTAALLGAMPENVRYYILTGARDDNVPTLWSTSTAIFLRDAGRPVTFYSQRDGTHTMATLEPIIAQAWNDMLLGIARSPSGLTGAANLPDAVPTSF